MESPNVLLAGGVLPDDLPTGLLGLNPAVRGDHPPGRIRVVVVVDAPVVPAAVERALDSVVGAPVDVLGIHVRPRAQSRSRRWEAAALVDRLDRALFRPAPDALAPVDLRHTFPALLRTAEVARPAWAPVVPDVVLDLTADGLGPGEAGSSHLGVWSLRMGSGRRRLSAAGFLEEYLSGSDVAVCELVAERPVAFEGNRSGPADVHVLYRSVSALDRHSPARTRNAAAWKSAEFPARVLTAMATNGGAMRAYGEPDAPLATRGPRAPSVAALGGLLTRRWLHEVGRRAGAQPSWLVAVRVSAGQKAPDPGFHTSGFRPVVPPQGRFYADPFVVRRPEGAYVFVEDGPVGGGPARISVVALDENGDQSTARVALERPTHLSYPFVFEHQDGWYMLPETAGTGTVELLRARGFPWCWEPCAVLLRDVRAWDPTLLQHGGLYWLFVNMAAPGARPSDELCLYFAPELTGPWRPHPMNPVVSDARRARPAGRILEQDGSLLRPAQDASGGYGRRIVLNRIDVLTRQEYRETPVESIEPGWLPGVVRTHTYTVDGDFEVLDGLRYEQRTWNGSRPGARH